MKWDKTALLAVVAVFSISYIYSSIKHMQRSGEVEEEKLKICSEQESYDCGLISKYHDECFSSSYRAEYRIRNFHPGEYNDCVDSKIEQHLDVTEN